MIRIFACMILTVLLTSTAHAQFACQPPMGQQMYELAAMNMTRAYRETPTPANRAKACNSHKRVVKVYQDAVGYCKKYACDEAYFNETCQKRADKLAEWKSNTAIVCGSAKLSIQMDDTPLFCEVNIQTRSVSSQLFQFQE